MDKTAKQLYDEPRPINLRNAELVELVHDLVAEEGLQHMAVSQKIPEENEKTAIRTIRIEQTYPKDVQKQAVKESMRQFVKAMQANRNDWRAIQYHQKSHEIMIGLVL